MHYVMSDIHGNYAAFRSVMNQIRLRPNDTLYVLGDVIDRYPYGIRILKYLMQKPNVKMLLGNHEYMMLNVVEKHYDTDDMTAQVRFYKALRLWKHNHGGVTLKSFARCRKDTRTAILTFLKSLSTEIDVTINDRSYKLVHGAPIDFYNSAETDYKSLEEFVVWNRLDGTEDTGEINDCCLIFGHTPTCEYTNKNPLEIWKRPDGKMIGIDCGSGFPTPVGDWDLTGRLACLRLEDMAVFYSTPIKRRQKNEI